MKIAFFFCENPVDPKSYPLGVGLLGAILTKKGHQVKGIYVHDYPYEPGVMESLIQKVRDYQPDLLCYSTTSYAFEHIKMIAENMRKNFDTIGFCGGMHPTLYPEQCLAVDGIDYICIGDGEEAIATFVENLATGKELTKTPNIYSLDAEGKMIRNPLAPLAQDLDQYPWTDYDLCGKDIINEIVSDGWLRYISSRGCPYQCTYCHIPMIRSVHMEGIGVTNAKLGFLRYRSVDSVIDEICILNEKYNLKVINFMDDLFAIQKPRAMEFAHKFKERVPESVGYSIQTHLEHMDQELIDALVDSRCLRVVVGLESASKRMLDLFKRPTSQARMLPRLSRLVKARFALGTWTLNILGNPTETQEEMIETLAFNARSGVERAKFNYMTPYPKSEMYDYCVANNLFADQSTIRNFDARYHSQLKFPERELAFLEKFWDIGHWYMNLYVASDLKSIYQSLVDEIEKIPFQKWTEVRERYLKIDHQISRKLLQEDIPHYNFVFKGKASGKVLGLVGGKIIETTKEAFDLDWLESANEQYV